jgi:2-amino-4-hydroxy-6-hydroxymethyldihydropteridine diphosphokinase
VSDPQPRYLNAALAGDTTLGPHALLDVLQRIEEDHGRERPYLNAPRTLDLDLILYGDLVYSDDRLMVPHQRFRERAFVLTPLAEVAPEMVDPQTGLTVGELLARLTR